MVPTQTCSCCCSELSVERSMNSLRFRREIVPKSCAANVKNPAFDRGLTYTFAYTNTYGEKLAEFTVDLAVCRSYR